MKKNAKLAALAILVLAAVAALSVGITLAVVNARMPAACTAIRYNPSIPPTICRRMWTSCGSVIRTTRPEPSFPTMR